MYIGAADGGLEHANPDVVAADLGNGNFFEPETGLGFHFHDGVHRFLHGGS
jgi:hypothetical protein